MNLNDRKKKLFMVILILLILNLPSAINSMIASDKDRQLVKSIEDKKFEQAIDLLNAGANPNAVVESSPNKFLSVKYNAFEEAIVLTRSVDQPNKRKALDNLIKTFICKGANIHQKVGCDDCLLFYSFSLETVKALTEAGIDINHKNCIGTTVLRSFLSESDIPEFLEEERHKIIDYLVSKGAK